VEARSRSLRIAVDAMGGDAAPDCIVDGAVAAARDLAIPVLLVGPSDRLRAHLARASDAADLDIEIADAPEAVTMGEPAMAALRKLRPTSIRVAVDAVRAGRAAALFSAGHTGATVMAAFTGFGMLDGIDRPALAATIPTQQGAAVLLDVGATVECRPLHLLQFAILGSAYAVTALGVERPRIGLLSIGEEAVKGNDLTREAYRLLESSGLPFTGNLEARDVYTGRADVIVCDGFTGNVALKISEGLVEAVEALLAAELTGSAAARVGARLARGAFRRFRHRVDYSEYGGAPLLGVAGVCLVGHGRSSAKAVKNGVALAARLAADDFLARVVAAVPAPPAGPRPAAH